MNDVDKILANQALIMTAISAILAIVDKDRQTKEIVDRLLKQAEQTGMYAGRNTH